MNWIDKLTEDEGGAGTADLWARVVRKSFLEKAGLKLGLGGNLSPGFPHHDRFGGPFGPTPELESQLQFFKFINFKNYLFIWLHQVLVAARKPLVVAQGDLVP